MTRKGREIFPNPTYWDLACAIKDHRLKTGELLPPAEEIARARQANTGEVDAALSKLAELGYIEPVTGYRVARDVTGAMLEEGERRYRERVRQAREWVTAYFGLIPEELAHLSTSP